MGSILGGILFIGPSSPCARNDQQLIARADNVHVKRDAGVTGREVSRDHDLSVVPDRIAEQEDGSGAECRGLEREVAPKRDAGRYSDCEVRHSNLELEGTDLPSDVGGGSDWKEDMGGAGP